MDWKTASFGTAVMGRRQDFPALDWWKSAVFLLEITLWRRCASRSSAEWKDFAFALILSSLRILRVPFCIYDYCCPLKNKTKFVTKEITATYCRLTKKGLTFRQLHNHHNSKKKSTRLKCWKLDRGGCGWNGEKRGSARKRRTKSLTFTEGRLGLGFAHYPTWRSVT